MTTLKKQFNQPNHMLKFFRFLLVFCAVFISQNSLATPKDAPIKVWSVPVTYALYSEQIKKISPVANYHALTLEFSTVQGALFGNVSDDDLLIIDNLEKDKFMLSLPTKIDADYQKLSSKLLTVTPPNTRIARLSTTHQYKDNSSNGGGAFVNTNTGETMMLVYVSQPVKVTGKAVSEYKYVYRYNIDLKKAGWHWLSFKSITDNVFDVYAPEEKTVKPEFAVILFDDEMI